MGRPDIVSASEKEGGEVVDRRPPTFTIDDLLAQIKPSECEGGVTVRELCEMASLPATNANMGRMRNKVKDAIALGLWEFVGKKPIFSEVMGTAIPTPAYAPKGGDA